MKKLLCLLLLFLVLPLIGFTQTDSVAVNSSEKPSLKHQIDFDVEFIALSLSPKFRISKNWLVGFNFGIGPVVSLGYTVDYHGSPPTSSGWFLTELLHLGIVAKTSNKTNKWSYEVEPRVSVIGWDDGMTFIAFSFGGGVFYGGKIQIGVRTAIGKMYNTGNKFFLSNTFIVRISLKTN